MPHCRNDSPFSWRSTWPEVGNWFCPGCSQPALCVRPATAQTRPYRHCSRQNPPKPHSTPCRVQLLCEASLTDSARPLSCSWGSRVNCADRSSCFLPHPRGDLAMFAYLRQFSLQYTGCCSQCTFLSGPPSSHCLFLWRQWCRLGCIEVPAWKW